MSDINTPMQIIRFCFLFRGDLMPGYMWQAHSHSNICSFSICEGNATQPKIFWARERNLNLQQSQFGGSQALLCTTWGTRGNNICIEITTLYHSIHKKMYKMTHLCHNMTHTCNNVILMYQNMLHLYQRDTYVQQCATCVQQYKTYVPEYDTYVPQCITCVQQSGTYVPQCDTYVQQCDIYVPQCDTFVLAVLYVWGSKTCMWLFPAACMPWDAVRLSVPRAKPALY